MRRLIRCLRRDDRGVTLVELIVAMGIFTTVVSVVLTGMVMMTRGTVRAGSQTDAMNASRVAFERLDRQVRYAEAINAPGTSGAGAQYVEFRIAGSVAQNGQPRCYQWRYDPSAKTLAYRVWDDLAGVTPPGFTVVARQVQAAPSGYSAPYPFAFTPASTSQAHQSLSLRLRIGASIAKVTVDTTTSFAARNSSTDSQTNLLSGTQSAAPVCLSVATRA